MKHLVFVLTALFCCSLMARDKLSPCRTRSRQMTMVKNCYTGDMVRPLEGGAQFFQSTETGADGVSYCYNSLISVEHKAGQLQIHVLRDSKDGQAHAYNFAILPDEIQRSKADAPLVSLRGLKGECFSPKGDKEVCNGGILKTIGLKDIDIPMVIALGKANAGQYTISHLVYQPKDLAISKPKEVEPTADQDANKFTNKIVQEIRHKLMNQAKRKLASVHTQSTTPKSLADSSEQFRFCSMALEGFLKEKKMSDPFSPDEKMTLATLTNFMNDDHTAEAAATQRMPASVGNRKVKGH